MKKRLFAMLLSALLLANVSACQTDKPNDNTDTLIEPPHETTAEQETEAPKSDDRLYAEALTKLAAGDVYGAYDIFLSISEYADVADYLDDFMFQMETYQSADHTLFYEYDACGRRISVKWLYPDGREARGTLYRYDEKGCLIEVDDGGITKYEYDSVGRPIKQIGPYRETVTLEYDDNGNITKAIGWGYIQENKYDAFGNRIENVLKTDSGLYLQTTVYEYNEHGDLIKQTVYETGGAVFVRVDRRYEYDKRGNKIRCISNEANTITDEWEYDAQGNLIKDTTYYVHLGNPPITFFWTYDQHGRNVEQRRVVGEETTTYFYLEYDAYGNLLKKFIDYTDPLEKDYVYSYTYRLCYNPNATSDGSNPLLNMPEEMVGKG